VREYARHIALHACRLLGLFRIARILTRKMLRILCYHGISTDDEHEFLPGTFMTAKLFGERLDYLVSRDYRILNLGMALDHLSKGTLPANSVVLTFDDGWSNAYRLAAPLLLQREIPSTIYVTTYHCVNESPVFRLVIQYMFWKTISKCVDLDGLGLPDNGIVPIENEGARGEIAWRVIRFSEDHMDESERTELSRELGRRLKVCYDDIIRDRTFTIMDVDEVKQAHRRGIDIQLHTHRHRLPLDPALAAREIKDNRAVLEPLLEKQLSHLCYPSGIWDRELFPVLEKECIRSATTCEPGFNTHWTPAYSLGRYLDSQRFSAIEFDSELSGLKECLRSIRNLLASQKDSSRTDSPPERDGRK